MRFSGPLSAEKRISYGYHEDAILLLTLEQGNVRVAFTKEEVIELLMAIKGNEKDMWEDLDVQVMWDACYPEAPKVSLYERWEIKEK